LGLLGSWQEVVKLTLHHLLLFLALILNPFLLLPLQLQLLQVLAMTLLPLLFLQLIRFYEWVVSGIITFFNARRSRFFRLGIVRRILIDLRLVLIALSMRLHLFAETSHSIVIAAGKKAFMLLILHFNLLDLSFVDEVVLPLIGGIEWRWEVVNLMGWG
jgi:hypothetical protein